MVSGSDWPKSKPLKRAQHISRIGFIRVAGYTSPLRSGGGGVGGIEFITSRSGSIRKQLESDHLSHSKGHLVQSDRTASV